MTGWLNSAGSGPLTWMLSNGTLIVWITIAWVAIEQHQRNGTQRQLKLRRRRRGPSREGDKGETNESQSDQLVRGRPEQGPALLYGGARVCQESGFFAGALSLADRGLARRAGRD